MDTSPKLRLFLWKHAEGTVPLGANLQTRGMTTNTNRPHRGALETATHLIFECLFAQQVWELELIRPAPDFIIFNSINRDLSSSSSLFYLPPSGITSDFFPWLCWNLWLARNRLSFENRMSSASFVVTNGACSAREWKHAQETHHKKPPPPIAHRPYPYLPPETSLCNSDAAWSRYTKKAGLVWVLYGENPTQALYG